MRVLIFFALIFSVNNPLNAQSSTSFSTFLSNGSGEINFSATIGDVFVTTFIEDNNILSQGFLQREINITTEIDELEGSVFFAYPNPTRERIYIGNSEFSSQDININKVELFDYSGRLIFTESDVNYTSFELSLNDYNSGVYILKLFINDTEQILRVVKM